VPARRPNKFQIRAGSEREISGSSQREQQFKGGGSIGGRQEETTLGVERKI